MTRAQATAMLSRKQYKGGVYQCHRCEAWHPIGTSSPRKQRLSLTWGEQRTLMGARGR